MGIDYRKSLGLLADTSRTNRTTTGRRKRTASPTSLAAPAPFTRHGDTIGSVNSTNTKPPTTNAIGPTRPDPLPPAAAMGNVTSGSGSSGNTDIMDQNFTGWAEGMRPDAAQMLFQEPQALLRNVMATMGMSANQNPGMYHMALPNADLVNALAMLQLGGSSDFSQGNINSVLNTMGDMFSQGLTRGGQGVDFRGGLRNALNAGIGTPLGDFVNMDDPRGQVQAMSSLLMPLAEAGLHPLFGQAFQAEINRLADEYYQRVAFGDPGGEFQDLLARRLRY